MQLLWEQISMRYLRDVAVMLAVIILVFWLMGTCGCSQSQDPELDSQQATQGSDVSILVCNTGVAEGLKILDVMRSGEESYTTKAAKVTDWTTENTEGESMVADFIVIANITVETGGTGAGSRQAAEGVARQEPRADVAASPVKLDMSKNGSGDTPDDGVVIEPVPDDEVVIQPVGE